ncbi:MAG: hypothetical protein IJ370_04100 [Oscillospiraceae bacterium]|nr:hypothetical protein [Oscillospiraceae bacterium]
MKNIIGYEINGQKCGRDKKGEFHCLCGKCKPLTEKEFELQKQLFQEKAYSLHLKRMVILFSIAFGFTLGCLLAVLIILLSTKI